MGRGGGLIIGMGERSGGCWDGEIVILGGGKERERGRFGGF